MANRLVLGAYGGTFGLRATKPTYNVLDMTVAARNVSFDSRWSATIATTVKGYATIPKPTGTGGDFYSSVTVSHSLGYKPYVWWVTSTDDSTYIEQGAWNLDALSVIVKHTLTTVSFHRPGTYYANNALYVKYILMSRGP